MNETRDEKLAARVAAVNRANGAAHQLYADLVKIFEPLVGVKLGNKFVFRVKTN